MITFESIIAEKLVGKKATFICAKKKWEGEKDSDATIHPGLSDSYLNQWRIIPKKMYGDVTKNLLVYDFKKQLKIISVKYKNRTIIIETFGGPTFYFSMYQTIEL